MTPLQSLKLNIEALNELINATVEQRELNQNILNNYVGFGGIPEITYDLDIDNHWDKSNQNIRGLLKDVKNNLIDSFGEKATEAVFESLRNSTLTAYYTPEEITNPITDFFIILSQFEDRKYKILEPSSGTGVFIKKFVDHSDFNNITTIEKDKLTALIQKKLFESKGVNIHCDSYEKLINTPEYVKEKFDLIISNIPFGDIKVFDQEYNRQIHSSAEYNSQKAIHSYFFIKSIDKLEKNGYLSFITSTSVSDSPNNDFLRRDILKKCELVEAIRLPNNVFNSTKVVSDLIILKKRTRTLSTLNELSDFEKKYLNTTSIQLENKGIIHESHVNNFFLDENNLPNNKVLGEFKDDFFHNKPMITISSDKTLNELSKDLNDLLSSCLENIKSKNQAIVVESKAPINTTQLSLFDMFEEKIDVVKNDSSKEVLIPKGIIDENLLQHGNLFFYKNKFGKIFIDSEESILQPLPNIHNQHFNQLKEASEILIIVKQLQNENSDLQLKDLNERLRNDLNSKYDLYVSKYGYFNSKKSSIVTSLEPQSFILLGIENKIENSLSFSKSDLFTENLNVAPIFERLNLKDAVNKSLNIKKEIDINFISELTGISSNEIIHTGLDQNLFFLNPNTNPDFNKSESYKTFKEIGENPSFNYATIDEFISGDVRFKIRELEDNPEWFDYSENHQRSLQLLQENELPFLKIDELEPKLGENWIPVNVFEDFATNLLNTRVSIVKSESNSSYKINRVGYSFQNETEYFVKCQNNRHLRGVNLLEHALHGTSPKITYTIKYSDNSTKTFLDREAMSNAQLKIDKINKEWFNYIKSNPNITEKLENIYNNVQNTNVERVYNGEHLELPGLKHFKPYKHQKDCIWQLVNTNGGLADHIVGAGKSLIIAATTMELKRLSISNKNMIIGLKSNIIDIYSSFNKAYPNAKILFPTEAEFSPKGRQLFFEKIKNNNWDAVILTHEQFQAIPQSRDIQEKIINQELKNLRLDLNLAIDNGEAKANSRTFKNLQKRIENKEVKLNQLIDSIKKDPNLLTFDKMGVDHLIVDESQVFKNLEFSTRHSSVAGLGSPEGSQRAMNLLFAIRTIQDKYNSDMGVSFFSGTPISNTLAELYLLKKYLSPNELKNRSMENFDSWARSYAELSRDFELSVTNEIKIKERFRSFEKVPELARWYRSFTNVANDNNIVIDKPTENTVLIDITVTPVQGIDFIFTNINIDNIRVSA
jgi:N12 class adenine-specific DNA methylase